MTVVCVIAVGLVCLNIRSIPEHRLQWWLSDLEWDSTRSYSGEGIKIAIIDTGVDINHKDLQNVAIEEIADLTNDEEKNEIKSLNHGTAVAGIIAGYPNDNKGLMGIAPDVKLLSIKIANNESDSIEVDQLVDAIEKAIIEDVDIVNISLGVLENDKSLEKAIQRATKNGIIIVAAAGNYMKNDLLYPAKYNNVIAVGAKTRKNTKISPYIEPEAKKVFYLPGDNIVTTISNNEYFSAYGTSFSTAMMTGVVAVMLEKNPELSYEQIVKILSGVELNNNSISIPDVLKEVSK